MSYPVKFGKYLLLERVNVGGMAEVFKAKTFGVAGFERILAIKRILPSLVEDEDFIHMFIDEARIAVQLNHANVIQIYELGKHGEHYYIAMEYMASKDLRAILDRQRLNGQLMPIPQAAFIISKICEGLDYAHRRRDPAGQPMHIVHRDVSPQNILVSYEGEVKVIDFGIAKAANRASRTEAGVLKGKFGYMSPEQVRGLPIDHRSDIFAMGVLLYEMVTGERLFIGESDFSTLERVRNAEVEPPTTFNKKISPELEQIMMRILAREVEDRYAWASELAEDLQRFLIEDRTIYSAKKLGSYMKDVYAADIAKERSKMEQFLGVGEEFDDATSSGRMRKSPPPAPTHSLEGIAVDVEDKTALRPGSAEPEEEFEDLNDAADKTFVIEASEAGVALAASPAKKKAPGKSAEGYGNTNEDFLHAPSLYGDESNLDDDDAKTQISFQNPFDENANKIASDLTSDPSEATQLRPPDDATLPPLPSITPSAAANLPAHPPMLSDDDATGILEPKMAAAMLGNAASAQAPVLPIAQPLAPQPDPLLVETEAAPVLKPKKKKKKKKISMGLAVAIVGGLFLTLTLFTGVVIFAAVKISSSSSSSEATWQINPAPGAPMQVSVFLDGENVGDSLPVLLPVKANAQHELKITAEGHQDFKMKLLPMSAGITTPIEVSLFEKVEKKETEKSAQVAALAQQKDSKKRVSTPKQDKKTSETAGKDASKKEATHKDTTGDANTITTASAAKKADAVSENNKPIEEDKTNLGSSDDTLLDDSALAQKRPDNLPPNLWRVSFATIARAGPIVAGAEIYQDGTRIGVTPFEGEFPISMNSVALEIRADGFDVQKLNLSRAGRAVVGPATLILAPKGSSQEQADSQNEEIKVAVVEVDDAQEQGDEAQEQGIPKPNVEKENDVKPNVEKENDVKPNVEKVEVAKAAPKRSTPASAKTRIKSRPKNRSKSKTTKAGTKMTHLSVGSRPSATVWIDRVKQKRKTPLMGNFRLALKPGEHWVTLKSGRDGKIVKIKIRVGADSKKNKLLLTFGGVPVGKGNVKVLKVQ